MTGDYGLSLDRSRASTARVYNFLLGGKDNYEADRKVGWAITESAPDAPAVARANLRFAGRAASWAVATFGITQAVDIGVGSSQGVPIPSVESCIKDADPNAMVLAFDPDEVVLAHARAFRPGYGGVLNGDVTDLETIFGHPDAVELIDMSRPMVVILAAVLHFIDDPAAVMTGLRDRLAPGSVIVLSHATRTRTSEARVGGMTKAYASASSPIIFREEEAIAALADGWDLLPPGLVDVQLWSPDGSYQEELYESVRVVGMVVRLPGLPEELHHAGGAR
ncbi:SAM-dependent methyltransferase [Actinomadura geliboluensis]|uniref:SAM-dependent methyltransferase n=1 Tax=Actinomadura geliboluensis TaxID=882440 RepID=UPI00260308CD|nr:SAM-dependent methyltransferase [Actinomadura geliboluensis]